MKNSFSILVLLLVLFSCNKYEHPPQETPACTLCPFAKSIEGTYRGLAVGYGVKNNPNLGSSFPKDSLTLIVEQVFQGKSNYIDSTIMYFKTTHYFDFDTAQVHKIIQIKRPDGYVENNAFRMFTGGAYSHSSNFFYIQPDEAKVLYQFDGDANFIVLGISATLYRQ